MRIYIKRAAVILAVMLLVVTYLVLTLWKDRTAKETFTPISKTIVIDAGHGGFDGGAESKNGTLEKDINLAVSLKLEQQLKKMGYTVIMTRSDDTALQSTRNPDASKKKQDMYERKRIMNESGADTFISIHMNLFSESKYKGAQVFYSKYVKNSKELAQSVQDELRAALDAENKREIKPADDGIFLLKSAKIPAVIVECGFLSNPEEEALLKDEAYQDKIAGAICLGIDNYFVAIS